MKNRNYAAMIMGFSMTANVCAQDSLPNAENSMASVATYELEAGPNVGSQPRPPRNAPPPVIIQDDAESSTAVEVAESRFHIALGVDYTTAYFSRGYRFEDSGWIAQPYAELTLDVFRFEQATGTLLLGTWNSFHGQATDAGTSDSFRKTWYESDVYAGAGLNLGNVALEGRYYIETSPSDAWDTIEEVSVSVAYDDSEWLGAWSLQPTAVLYVETGSNAIDGQRKGTHLQLGVSPGFTVEEGALQDVAISFPVAVGLSLSNYYEGLNGENDFFGYLSVGAIASVPLGLDESWGGWTLSVGVQGLFLGDATSTFNDDDHAEVIGTLGVSIEI
jgi:hypothetical protein